MSALATPPRPASYDKKVALVLQGGGARGSYQAGVYEALSTSDYPLDWVAGIWSCPASVDGLRVGFSCSWPWLWLRIRWTRGSPEPSGAWSGCRSPR